MKVECTISLGELIDKLSILMIKEQMITDKSKIKHIKNEKHLLEEKLALLQLNNIELHLKKLTEINFKLWKIEDDIRDKERKKEFDQEFIDLARAVYVTNDERFNCKNMINSTYNSSVVEVKSYKNY